MVSQDARRDEHGQAIVLLALALVGLLGFAALALDGGNLYTEQRRAQAAADNAVMAAAFGQMKGISSTVSLQAAAFLSAQANGYINNQPRTALRFHKPPIHGPYAGNNDYMEVVITQTVDTALAHLVYRQNPIPITVFAVAHGTRADPVMFGYAIASMNPICGGSNTIGLQGRGSGWAGGTYLTDGGVWVNSNCPDALEVDGRNETFMTDGEPIDIVGGFQGSACPSPNYQICPAPGGGNTPIQQDPIQGTPAGVPPPCPNESKTVDAELAAFGNYITPGTYVDMSPTPGRSFTMNPGIYCMKGNASLDPGNGDVTGVGVLLHMVDTSTTINFSGSGHVRLEAPTRATTGCTGVDDTSQNICAYLGFLIYKTSGVNLCEQSAMEIDFSGQGGADLVGLIYAPKSLVRFTGSSSAALTLTGQLIVGCVKFSGNGNINVVYDPEAIYNPPPAIRLDE